MHFENTYFFLVHKNEVISMYAQKSLFSRRFEMSALQFLQKAEIKYLEYFTDITNGLWRQSRHLQLNDR